jgi:hypothetical protein
MSHKIVLAVLFYVFKKIKIRHLLNFATEKGQ